MAPVHVLVFPWPLQGHINSMLPFAAGLLGAGVHVTVLHTEHNLRRVDVDRAKAAASPRLRFVSVPDGLPDDHPRSVGHLSEIGRSLRPSASAAYRALLSAGSHADADCGFPPVSCVVADGLLPFAIDIAEELGVPALAFRTESACSFLAYLSVPKLVELGEVPIPVGAKADLDEPVRGVPGMEGFLRRRDLPSFCRGHGETGELDHMLQVYAKYTAHSCKARALIFNTTASLERSALARIAPHMRDVFAIGPLHAISAAPASATSTSLWREDDGCMAWLDGHADRSVVYVSLGSLAIISREQFTEFLSGLVSAGYAFLWALRPDMVGAGLQEAVDAAGQGRSKKVRVVDWAPQRDVLRHRAVGCFLTHAGWNSTLEGIAEGVPLVCWPFFADQQINSRFTAAVWGTGLDMKDVCERAVVERMVREAMESGELSRSAQALALQVRRDIAKGGSSASEFERLVKFIKDLTAKAGACGIQSQHVLMTMFYNGAVNVFDVPVDKAREITVLASRASVSSPPSAVHKSYYPVPVNTARFPVPGARKIIIQRLGETIAPHASVISTPIPTVSQAPTISKSIPGYQNYTPAPMTFSGVPSSVVPPLNQASSAQRMQQASTAIAAAMKPIAVHQSRKASLARFLEKRKEKSFKCHAIPIVKEPASEQRQPRQCEHYKQVISCR